MTRTAKGRRVRLLPAALIIVSVALTLTGVLLLVRAHTLRSDAALTNHAVIDAGATGEVIGQVSTALNQVLSYDYRKPATAKAAAAHWLAGDAPRQYTLLFTELQKLAPGQKLTLVAKVVDAGVTSLRGSHAQLLVFLDQESTRASDHQSSVSAAQIQIGAEKRGKTWKITELKPL